jgi:hypothetical protein
LDMSICYSNKAASDSSADLASVNVGIVPLILLSLKASRNSRQEEANALSLQRHEVSSGERQNVDASI